VALYNCIKNDTFGAQARQGYYCNFWGKIGFFLSKNTKKLITGNFREIGEFFDIAVHLWFINQF